MSVSSSSSTSSIIGDGSTLRTMPLQQQQQQSPPPQEQERRARRSFAVARAEPAVNASKIVRGRRKLKSALYLACYSAAILLPAHSVGPASAFSVRNSVLSPRRHEWIERSVQYYSGVMRKNTGAPAQVPPPKTQIDSSAAVSLSSLDPAAVGDQLDEDFVGLATKHYYARLLIKSGKWELAEKIYRRAIRELTADDDGCDHTKLAVSTLLLALHVQRTGDVKATRAVFVNFFRRVALVRDGEDEDEVVGKCSCSAKVLQAYALFEMKCGHPAKSLEIIQRAIKMDEKLSPVLGWKQFRDAAAGKEYSPTFSFWKGTGGSRNGWRGTGGGLSP